MSDPIPAVIPVSDRAKAPRREHRSDDYWQGYQAGFGAARRMKDRQHGRFTYRRIYWRCSLCGHVGFILKRSDDDGEKVMWRMQQSHENQFRGPRGRCRETRMQPLSLTEARRFFPEAER